MTVLGSLTTRSRRTADRFAGLPNEQAALVRLRIPGDRPRAVHHPSDRGRLATRCDGQPEEVIAGGLLQEVLEQTATTGAELRHRFGVRIARLVETV